jgi:hypothetical protein
MSTKHATFKNFRQDSDSQKSILIKTVLPRMNLKMWFPDIRMNKNCAFIISVGAYTIALRNGDQ